MSAGEIELKLSSEQRVALVGHIVNGLLATGNFNDLPPINPKSNRIMTDSLIRATREILARVEEEIL